MNSGVSTARLDLASGTERFQRLAQELGITSFGINLIRLQPGNRGRIHKHATQEEVYLVLEGTLSLVVDGAERDMTKGEIARVAPDVKRQLVNRGPGRCVVLAMGGQNEHVGKDGTAFVSWDAKEGKPPLETPLPEDLPASELRKG
ncbi:MAG TPA: cupin domain-containing protein [Candidatus Polarisedimenticolaceae bacterium]|nr:cupin domain-containing protein [Candidatus Polarisedimenticolaceae bacterium]